MAYLMFYVIGLCFELGYWGAQAVQHCFSAVQRTGRTADWDSTSTVQITINLFFDLTITKGNDKAQLRVIYCGQLA